MPDCSYERLTIYENFRYSFFLLQTQMKGIIYTHYIAKICGYIQIPMQNNNGCSSSFVNLQMRLSN